MADPLDVLGGPDQPVEPDPVFAARLRARLERALSLPERVTVSDAAVLHPDDLIPGPPGRSAGPLTPYLAVAGADAAIAFYREVLGAEVVEGPIVMDDGRIGHAGLRLPGGAELLLSEEHPVIGVTAPAPGAGSTVSLHLVVDDADEVVARFADAGAAIERAPSDNPYGRMGVVRDPFGHRWMLIGPVAADRREGDAGYVSLWVPDADATAAFFATVLGWDYAANDPGRPANRQLAGRRLEHGIQGGVVTPTLFTCYAVGDLDAAVARVRAARGDAAEPTDEPWGRTATCTDDQGTPFALYQPAAGVAGELPDDPLREGDLAYVTYEVVDAGAFRAFFGSVLGWRFSPGSVPEGWQIEGVRPMGGVHGGHEQAVTVPLYAVDDIDAAVARVRAAGGRATDPEQQPYGRTSSCAGPAGVRFYLGQLG
jgi:uncharacterized glyoxalase superfamily protein PhnB